MDTSKGSYLMKKIIKRAAAVVCGTALAATMTLSAFALPSPSVSGFVKGVQSAVDANGNAVNIIVQLVADAKFDAAEQKAVDALRANPTAELKRILGSEYKDTLQLVDIRNVKIDGDASKVKFPVTVTFDVPGVTASSEAILLHYVEKDNRWEVIHAKTGDKTIEASFNSLSPVAFVVDTTTATNMDKTDKTSPKTGEPAVPMGAIVAVIAVAAGGLFFAVKRGTVSRDA